MHAVVMQSLEEYLAGALEPAACRKIESHLDDCESCREEIGSMREVSQWFGSLRVEEPVAPPPVFFARVMAQVDRQNAVLPITNIFSFGFAFGRRLIFASLLTLAVLGTYLVSRETSYPSGPSPEAILAQQEAPAFDSAPPQDNMLVTLTAYDQ